MRYCKVKDCNTKCHSGGYCNTHRMQIDRIGRIGTLTERHGMSRTPEYRAWEGMKRRCGDGTWYNHRNYSGRGIRVCENWLRSFTSFYNHIGKRPGKGYSIDRINNDGDYEPGNVRWATSKEQNNNKRSNSNQHKHL